MRKKIKAFWNLMWHIPNGADVKVNIHCRCGPFIPAVFRVGKGSTRVYSCDHCEFKVHLSDHFDPIDW